MAAFMWWVPRTRPSLAFIATIPLVAAGILFWIWTRRVRKRNAIRRQAIPKEWEAALVKDVAFFRALDAAGRKRFLADLQLFLGEKRVTAIGFELDTTTYVLAGASAVIPVFGFPDWDWHQISEILIYPSRFNQEFEIEGVQSTLGMVGTGAMNRIMILSKPDLIAGFRNAEDRRNVGIHEFAHLLDKTDGNIDGIPDLGLSRATAGPWQKLVQRKMEEMRRGDSDIDPYGLTNEAEFFAVSTEYFFERPIQLKHRHPDLYAALAKIFRQDLGQRAKELWDSAMKRPKPLGRNSPCPCASGKKYKRCCLRNSR